MQLYYYQNNSVTAISNGFKQHKRIIFVLPTGGGKTVVFSEIAHLASLKGKVVLVLTDRIELFEQASKSIVKRNIPICKINANTKRIYEGANLFVGMVQTVARRLDRLNIKPDLIIVDEAHKGNFFKILNHWPDAFCIGATATPVNKHLYKYYTHIVQEIDIPELVQQGFLVPCRAFQMQDDFSDLETKGTGVDKEFTDESLMLHFNKAKLYDGVVDKWKEKCFGKKTVVFCVNIEHAEKTCERFREAGIPAYCVTSKTSQSERVWILKEFSQPNTFYVLVNCGILTTGWDEPNLQAVVVNRATLSLPLWLQMCGRGSRPLTGLISNLKTPEERVAAIASCSKPFFTVLDFGLNHDRHGLWHEARKWSLSPPKKKKKPSGVVPLRTCQSCGAMLPVQQKKCDFCEFEIKEKDLKLLQGELVELTPKIPEHLVGQTIEHIDVEDLISLQEAKVHKATYIFRELRKRGEQAIKEFAQKKGYKRMWVEHQISQMYEEAKSGGTKITYSKIKNKQL